MSKQSFPSFTQVFVNEHREHLERTDKSTMAKRAEEYRVCQLLAKWGHPACTSGGVVSLPLPLTSNLSIVRAAAMHTDTDNALELMFTCPECLHTWTVYASTPAKVGEFVLRSAEEDFCCNRCRETGK